MLGGCGGFARAYSSCQGEFGIIKLFPVPSISLHETVRGPTRGPHEHGQLHRLYSLFLQDALLFWPKCVLQKQRLQLTVCWGQRVASSTPTPILPNSLKAPWWRVSFVLMYCRRFQHIFALNFAWKPLFWMVVWITFFALYIVWY